MRGLASLLAYIISYLMRMNINLSRTLSYHNENRLGECNVPIADILMIDIVMQYLLQLNKL